MSIEKSIDFIFLVRSPIDMKSISRFEYLLIFLILILPDTSIDVIFLLIIFVAFLIFDKLNYLIKYF